jgi:predicted RNase H-like HicB family nuclease
MATLKYVYWQDEDMWIGYLEAYPDFLTQGETLEDLQEHLKDIHQEVASGTIPLVRHVGELAVA